MIKAICKLDVVAPSQNIPGAFHAIIGFAGLEPGNIAAGSITLLDQPSDIGLTQIKDAVQAYLVLNHGYIFAPEDSVRFLGDIT